MSSQSLAVLLVSDQRQAIREISRFLEALGYRINGALDTQQAIAAMNTGLPEIIIIDESFPGKEVNELFEHVAQTRDDIYALLMTETPDTKQIVNALKVGFDDFLAKPVVFGELLARLRAGARLLEHRRRLNRQHDADPATGLPSRDSFCRILKGMLSAPRRQSDSLACISLNLDFFTRFGQQYGQPFADRTLKAIAQSLSQFARASEPIACGGGDQFFVAIDEASEKEGQRWADQFRAHLAERPVQVDDIRIQVTASGGVAATEGDSFDAEELIQRALDAQRMAKGSGRDCVMPYSQLHDDSRSWASLATPGKLFASTCARDVMTPCPVVLRRDDTIAKAKTLLGNSGLSISPVVDGVGNAVGYVSPEEMDPAHRDGRVRDAVNASVQCFDESTEFSTLIDVLTRDSHAVIIVVREGRPIGLVTCCSLAALSDPLEKSPSEPKAYGCA